MVLTGFGAGGNDGNSPPVAPPRPPPATRDAGLEVGGVARGVLCDELALPADAFHGTVVTLGVGCIFDDVDGGRVGKADSPLELPGVPVLVHVPLLLWLEREDCWVDDFSLRTRDDLAGAMVTFGGMEAVTPAQPTLALPVMPLGPGRDG